jgi:hypothetical protein
MKFQNLLLCSSFRLITEMPSMLTGFSTLFHKWTLIVYYKVMVMDVNSQNLSPADEFKK